MSAIQAMLETNLGKPQPGFVNKLLNFDGVGGAPESQGSGALMAYDLDRRAIVSKEELVAGLGKELAIWHFRGLEENASTLDYKVELTSRPGVKFVVA